jgi:hypothetical protein
MEQAVLERMKQHQKDQEGSRSARIESPPETKKSESTGWEDLEQSVGSEKIR